VLGGCGLGGATDVTGTWNATLDNGDGTVSTLTMTLQQIGDALTGTWATSDNTFSLTGSINGQHVHLENHATGPSGECDAVWEFTLTDSTHLVGRLTQTFSQPGACGDPPFDFNVTAVKK
jgi:hypothetical protein